MARPNKFDGMMHEYCAAMGWCGVKDGKALHVTDMIPDTGLVSADDFAKWLILADGLDPDDHFITREELKSVFIKHMGADAVDARRLRSDWR